jgi:hypothetical protein
MAGLSRPSKSISINDTQIVFVDFSEPLRVLGGRKASGEKR